MKTIYLELQNYAIMKQGNKKAIFQATLNEKQTSLLECCCCKNFKNHGGDT